MAESRHLLMELSWGEEWTVDAACRGMGPELFYPDIRDDDKTTKARIAKAKKICASCPVQAECLEYIMSKPSYNDDGIWGGTTTRERKHLRIARKYNASGSS